MCIRDRCYQFHSESYSFQRATFREKFLVLAVIARNGLAESIQSQHYVKLVQEKKDEKDEQEQEQEDDLHQSLMNQSHFQYHDFRTRNLKSHVLCVDLSLIHI
eukprot:TRINITY_DN1560_c0_g1_i4.p3 TRINITY_DN1560_c0_g1~~TRINITY_DN1560_c0_g1_i4.p3  ORF type:complete len:103 (-),score=7.57 TRINITY_DN1560_c0_g1_i4:4-312(-)